MLLRRKRRESSIVAAFSGVPSFDGAENRSASIDLVNSKRFFSAFVWLKTDIGSANVSLRTWWACWSAFAIRLSGHLLSSFLSFTPLY